MQKAVVTILLSASSLQVLGAVSAHRAYGKESKSSTLPSTSASLLSKPTSAASLTESAASYLKNWGLINSKGNSHIHAPEAWKIEQGSKKTIVAVIDTGLDPSHKNLSRNVWSDPKVHDKSVFGWNYVADKPNPIDDHGHGTHVAGIIGATADKDSGVSGVAQNVSIMAVKYYSDANTGTVNLRNTVKAIRYAVSHGAKIINYSGGGPEFSEEEFLAIKEAEAKGVLVVAAAGNEHQDTDRSENAFYPAAYGLSNIITVAATNIRNELLSTSNWGRRKVDVAAPGENIYSTLPGGRFGPMTGTSQATAFVSGLAALLISKDPALTPQRIKEVIMASVDHLPQLEGKVATAGRINAYAALLALRNPAPKRQQLLPNRSLLSLVESPAIVNPQ